MSNAEQTIRWRPLSEAPDTEADADVEVPPHLVVLWIAPATNPAHGTPMIGYIRRAAGMRFIDVVGRKLPKNYTAFGWAPIPDWLPALMNSGETRGS